MPHQNRLDDADADEEGDEGAAAVADEGQGEAGDRHDLDVHADGDGGLEEKEGGDADADKATGRIRRDRRHAQDPHQNKANQKQYHQRTKEKAHLLRNHGKDEVRVLHPEETELALRTLKITFAEPAT